MRRTLLFLVALLLAIPVHAGQQIMMGFGAAAGPVTLFSDTFTEAGDTALGSHTADTGEAWSGGDTADMTVYEATDSVGMAARTDSRFGILNETAASADYYVEVVGTVSTTTASNRVGAAVRWADTTHFYYCYFDGTGAVKLYLNNAGWTQLGATGQTIAGFNAANTYTLRLSADGSSLVCAVDGTTEESATDGTLTAAGKPAINLGNTAPRITSATAVTIP